MRNKGVLRPLPGWLLLAATSGLTGMSCPFLDPEPRYSAFTYEIVAEFPHDPQAFTQGLVFVDGYLYEGTGLRGESSLRKVELETGEVLQSRSLASHLFGEGITVFGDRIIQLTWQSHAGFVYDKETFDLISEFSYSGEGWGITHDGERLIMSDGTATLRFRDPDTLEETGQIEVRDGDTPVLWLNELEYINGEVFANVWRSDRIAIIDPGSGRVNAWLNLEGLLSPEDAGGSADVLNGIAYDGEGDRLFVTGKRWPKLFEIVMRPAVEASEKG